MKIFDYRRSKGLVTLVFVFDSFIPLPVNQLHYTLLIVIYNVTVP